MNEKKKDNGFVSVLVNIIVPAIILIKFSTAEYLGPVNGLMVALAFPLVYGIWDLIKSKKWNGLSVLGVVSTMLTGGIGLLELDPTWIAIKEAAVPLVIALVLLGSMKTEYPIVRTFISQIIDLEKAEAAIPEKDQEKFQKRFKKATYVVIASFFLSAALNYILARIIVVSEAGTEQFNEELGRLTALSYPVIAFPSTAVMIAGVIWLVYGITKNSALSMEELLKK